VTGFLSDPRLSVFIRGEQSFLKILMAADKSDKRGSDLFWVAANWEDVSFV
jgi:hypothetical protein